MSVIMPAQSEFTLLRIELYIDMSSLEFIVVAGALMPELEPEGVDVTVGEELEEYSEDEEAVKYADTDPDEAADPDKVYSEPYDDADPLEEAAADADATSEEYDAPEEEAAAEEEAVADAEASGEFEEYRPY